MLDNQRSSEWLLAFQRVAIRSVCCCGALFQRQMEAILGEDLIAGAVRCYLHRAQRCRPNFSHWSKPISAFVGLRLQQSFCSLETCQMLPLQIGWCFNCPLKKKCLHSYSCLLWSVVPFGISPRCGFNSELYLEIWRWGLRCSTDFWIEKSLDNKTSFSKPVLQWQQTYLIRTSLEWVTRPNTTSTKLSGPVS